MAIILPFGPVDSSSYLVRSYQLKVGPYPLLVAPNREALHPTDANRLADQSEMATKL